MKIKKYLFAFGGAFYGTVVGIIALPGLIVFQEFREDFLPAVQQNPFIILNIFKIIAALFQIVSALFVGFSLAFVIGVDTALAFYNRGWKAGLVPFKLVITYSIYRNDMWEKIANVTSLNSDEKKRELEAIIILQAVQMDAAIREAIESDLEKTSTESRKLPPEISAIITGYLIEGQSKAYRDSITTGSEYMISGTEAADIAEKYLHTLGHKAQKNSVSGCPRFFPCLRENRRISPNNNDEALQDEAVPGFNV